MNPYSALADSNEPVDPTDVEFFKFTGLVPDVKVALQEEPFVISKYPANVSLIAVSSKHGYFAAATTQGFTFGSTKSLRSTFYKANKGATVTLDQDRISISLSNAIRQLRFSADETQLLVAAEGGIILVYNVNDVSNNKEQSTPIHTFNLNHDIIDLRPNPEALPNLAAVLFNNNHCKIIDITNGNTECEIPLENISAICWSPKGKQIVFGKLDGGLEHYDTKAARKDALSIPKYMKAGHGEEKKDRYVQDVLWIENHIFLVLYARHRENDEDEYVNDGFIINRKPVNRSNEPEYIRLAEITPIFTTEGRGNHFYMEVIRDLGKEIKHLVIIANAATNELSVVGQNEEWGWATWMLPENGLANLPLSAKTSMDTYPLGLALDLSADEKLPPFDASENDVGVNPMPIFYYINDEGHIGSYHCYNIELARSGGSYTAPSSTVTTTAPTTTTPAPAPVAQAPSAFSAFGSVASSIGTSSFGDLLSGKSVSTPPATSTSVFGSFGAPAGGSIPSFSNLGLAQKIPATPSAGFGASKPLSEAPPAAPMFGSTSNIGFSTNKAVFGADKPLSAFENAAASATKSEQVVPESKITDGSTSGLFGSMKLGQTSAPAAEVTTSAFGSFGSLAKTSIATSAFGSTDTKKSAFGSANLSAPATATSAFGSPSTFGSSGGFGSLAKNTVSGATAPTTAFGSTSSLGSSSGGFGSLAKTTTSITKPAFSTTATIGGFGSLAKNTVPGATTPTTTPAPAFGSTSSLGTGGGFGSLAKNTVPGATAPTTTPAFGSTFNIGGSSGFGSSSTTKTGTTFGSTTSLGSGSGFGSLVKNTVPGATTPTTTPAFGSLAKNTVPGATAPTFGSTATLGSGGGFGSLAKNTVPGATAPTTAPTFGSSSGFGSFNQKSTTPTVTTSTTKPATESAAPAAKGSAPPSPTSTTTTAKPDVESSTPKPTAATATTPKPTKEKLEPTAAEGMAREYESLYITVCEGIDELKETHEKINTVMSASTTPKTETNLKTADWTLNDVAEYGDLTQKILASIVQDQASTVKMKESIELLSASNKKSMDKKEDIKYLLQKEIDVDLVDLMDNRELDAETKTTLNTIQNKSESNESTLNDLEFKVQEHKKRNKIKNDHHSGELTLYSLHRAIRDIRRDILVRNNDLAHLEEKLANMKLNESRRRARQSTRGFSVEDLSNSEEGEEEEEINSAVINHTTRYLRRFNFLNDVCNNASKRSPLQCPVD